MSPEPPFLRIVAASDSALLVSFGSEISLESHAKVLQLTNRFKSRKQAGILNLHPAYSSILIRFDPLRLRGEELAGIVQAWVEEESPGPFPESRLVEIPVWYGGEFGPDLADVARHAGLTEAQVVEMHASVEYRVHFLGFTPGFPYLAGLPAVLATPRLNQPRKRIPAGSVAIGGVQTGIYPLASPGGWRLVGRTPVRLFEPGRDPIAWLRMGDRVRFVPIPPSIERGA